MLMLTILVMGKDSPSDGRGYMLCREVATTVSALAGNAGRRGQASEVRQDLPGLGGARRIEHHYGVRM